VTFDSHLNLEQEDQMIDEIMQQLNIDESFTFMQERDKDSIRDRAKDRIKSKIKEE